MSAFAELQRKLVEQWPSIGNPTDEDKTMVVVPSLTIELPPQVAPLLPAYEERFLFLLLLLKQPRARVIYVTSQPVSPRVVDYYLGLSPGLDGSDARSRLTFISLGDPSLKPLTQKILDRPRAVERIRRAIPDPDRAHLVPFNTTELEEDLAVAIGIPIFGADSRTATFGTKAGARRLFEEEGIPHPRGFPANDRNELIAAIERMLSNGHTAEAMVKLNEGVGGLGNAVLTLDRTNGDVQVLIEKMQVEGGDVARFLTELEHQGGIVEERITGDDLRSPSVQLRVSPLGDVELLSTHDQVLGGPTGQAFFGSRFPADPAYAPVIAEHAHKVAGRLAKEGVIGRFAIDFVVVRNNDTWDAFAIEINLRKGGTTHPFLTLQFLAGGNYVAARSTYECDTGTKCYVATDHLEAAGFDSLTPDDLLDMVTEEDLRWDPDRAEGVVFHMISALPVAGRIGMTAVGATPERADAIYRAAEDRLSAAASGSP